MPLVLTAATDAVIYKKKIFGSDNTFVVISNAEVNDIMKIVKSLEESGLLTKEISKKSKRRIS